MTGSPVSPSAASSDTRAGRTPATPPWLSNGPAHLNDETRGWCRARAPKWRWLSYLLREVMAWYPAPQGFPLLFVSDGAAYEGLGLLELLRHRCGEIYCFDASSDSHAWAAAIADSITLAKDELGVQIELKDPDAAMPAPLQGDGAGQAASPPRRSLFNGKITYSALDATMPASEGILVIGRAELDAGIAWELSRHRAAHPQFPHDTTGDQWFDDEKFNAYTELGRHVGKQAFTAMELTRANQHPPVDIAPVSLDSSDASGTHISVEADTAI